MYKKYDSKTSTAHYAEDASGNPTRELVVDTANARCMDAAIETDVPVSEAVETVVTALLAVDAASRAADVPADVEIRACEAVTLASVTATVKSPASFSTMP